MSHNNGNDGSDQKHERQENKGERTEKKAENKERSEAAHELSSGSLNEQKRQEQSQEKADRSQSLAEQIQRKGVAKIGPITNHFRQSIEISQTDAKTGKPETLVKGRSQEEVDEAQKLKHLQEASEQGLLIGAGGNFVPEKQASKPSFDEQIMQIQKDAIKQGAPPELFVQGEKASEYKVLFVPQLESNKVMSGAPVIQRDGKAFYQGQVSNQEQNAQEQQKQPTNLIESIRTPIEPAIESVSKFTAESSRQFNALVEQAKEAVGLSASKAPLKPIHQATGDGSTLPEPIQKAGDAAQLGTGYITGFVKAVDQVMPGMTPRGAIEGVGQMVKQAGELAKDYAEHENKLRENPIETVVQDALTAKKMYDGAVDWANKRSQTESFAERGQDIGKVSPDVLMASEIIFAAKSGKLIAPRDAAAMKLETKTAEELEALGIRPRTVDQIPPEEMVNPIDRYASAQDKVRQLQALSAENQRLVEDFAKHIDEKFGTKSSEPNLKEQNDILLKADRPQIKEMYPWFEIEHVRDSLRFKTSVDDLSVLPAIAKDLKESQFQIINPDVDKLVNPKGRGWRMAAFDLRAPNGQIIEYQVLCRELDEAGKIEHSTYKNLREKDVRTMSMEEQIEKWHADKEARNMYQDAWDAYLKRTKRSDAEIRKVVDATKKILQEEQ